MFLGSLSRVYQLRATLTISFVFVFVLRENMAQSIKTVEPQADSRKESLRDTKWLFYSADALVVSIFNSAIWEMSTREGYKLSLNPGDFTAITHRNVVRNATLLGKGTSRQFAEHRMRILIRLSNGLGNELFVEPEIEVGKTSVLLSFFLRLLLLNSPMQLVNS